ncbi:MAG: 30S ribosomal protein S11 [Leptospiraceae bacterium]|nr:30S ribosomal protein S11 [Leptospiraceae bacterium]
MAQSGKKKEKRTVTNGTIHIQATFNNTIVSVADRSGNVIGWSSAGHMNFRGARKSTPYAAQMAARDAIEKCKDYGLKEVDVLLKGPGIGRESAVRAISNEGIHVRSIRDVTPLPHNGCRPRKKRRV